jgi:DsbC/DsbD-like thiol-disulfide interchange protein
MAVRKQISIGRNGKVCVGIALILAACVAALVLYFAFRRPGVKQPDINSQPAHLVQAELLSNTEAIVPGRPFLLGARFQIAPQWHIYGEYPGDAGLPTTVDLEMPDGFAAGSLLYPKPARFNQPGDIVGYGYKNEVMLLIRVSPPADLPLGQTVALQADARWLACKEKCILGEKRLELQLPVAMEARPLRNQLFAKWIERISPESETAAGGAFTEWGFRGTDDASARKESNDDDDSAFAVDGLQKRGRPGA